MPNWRSVVLAARETLVHSRVVQAYPGTRPAASFLIDASPA